MADTNEMTINLVVLGKTQTGKSAAGNSLLGSSDFESRRSPSSVTTCCSLGRSCRILGIMRRNGCELALRVRVLDTPSYPHSALSKEQVRDMVGSALAHHFGEEGLHLALLVLRADLPLCLDESNDAVQFIQIVERLKSSVRTRACEQGLFLSVYRGPHPLSVPDETGISSVPVLPKEPVAFQSNAPVIGAKPLHLCNTKTKIVLQELLGPTWKDFTAVLLTHADKAEEAGCSEETYLHSASSTLLSLLSSVQHKYIFLDNQKSIIKEERTIVLRKLLNFIRQNNYQVLLPKHGKE